MNKKYYLRNSIVLLLFLFFGFTTYSQVDLTASVDEIPPLTNGQTFNYSIDAAGPAWVATRIKLIYDPSVIQLNSFTPVYAFDLIPPGFPDISTPGLIKFEGVNFSPISSDITIFTIEFEVLNDSQNITVSHNYDMTDGTVVTNNSGSDILGTANDILLMPLSTNDDEFKNSLSIYPNPVNDVLFIKTNRLQSKIKTIDINGIDGKLIKTVNAFDDTVSINVSNLTAAMYFMTITSEDDYKATYKFLVK